MSAKILRDFNTPARTMLILVVVLALTGSPGCAQDDVEQEAVSQSPDATVMPNEVEITDLPVAVDVDTSDDENTAPPVEEMRVKTDNIDAGNALPTNPDDVSTADTDTAANSGRNETESATQEDGVITGVESESTIQANETVDSDKSLNTEKIAEIDRSTSPPAETAVVASGGEQMDSTTQVEKGNAGIESVDEEMTESVTITPEEENAADERNVSSEENTESVLGTSSSADTEAAAKSGVQIDSSTQVEEKNAEIASESEESTANATATTADGNAADEQDVVTEEKTETIPNTTSPGDVEFAKENIVLSTSETGTDGKYATKEELNYVSNLVIDLQRKIKSVKNTSVSENRFTEIEAVMDAIRKDLDKLKGGKPKPEPEPEPEPEPDPLPPEGEPPAPFKLIRDEDGTPHLQRKGQVAELYLQELADDGRCKEIGNWLKQTGKKLEKRVVFVQKNNRVSKCKQVDSGEWKVYSSSASDTGYVALPNGD